MLICAPKCILTRLARSFAYPPIGPRNIATQRRGHPKCMPRHQYRRARVTKRPRIPETKAVRHTRMNASTHAPGHPIPESADAKSRKLLAHRRLSTMPDWKLVTFFYILPRFGSRAEAQMGRRDTQPKHCPLCTQRCTRHSADRPCGPSLPASDFAFIPGMPPGKGGLQSRSMTPAMPYPPPIHMVTRPKRFPVRISS